ncbi:hypothetical protein Ancab_021430 [Ancistrocladus abbreviatus]
MCNGDVLRGPQSMGPEKENTGIGPQMQGAGPSLTYSRKKRNGILIPRVRPMEVIEKISLHAKISARQMVVATRESSRRFQASVGTHHNLSLLSTMAGKHLSQITSDAQGSQDVATDWILTDTCNLLRLAPETTQNIEEFVLKFYESLPSTTIVCLSLLGGAYPMLLQKFLPHRPVHWR